MAYPMNIASTGYIVPSSLSCVVVYAENNDSGHLNLSKNVAQISCLRLKHALDQWRVYL